MEEFSSDYLNESGRRILILGRISINGSVEYLGVTDFHITGGTFWAANIVAPGSIWGDGGTTINKNWVVNIEGTYGSVDIPWSIPVPIHPDYVPRSL